MSLHVEEMEKCRIASNLNPTNAMFISVWSKSTMSELHVEEMEKVEMCQTRNPTNAMFISVWTKSTMSELHVEEMEKVELRQTGIQRTQCPSRCGPKMMLELIDKTFVEIRGVGLNGAELEKKTSSSYWTGAFNRKVQR